ncbi:2-phospho-L-lactate transferase [Kineosporia sp. NBRC 101731]|uniref:2-phospho-L-lactate transferase n=1 Tax=Kineosporia sp. NBRC 101731 TaxID=3032199 RepID=UPI0024A4C1DE|nr:2-phospho-L-lactate transferase [Kineosporia sp. NBRC 101731]GLY28454.1 2-phospho-L-lactate transferase [Kineosporia sp. NBRC 101731]
MRITALAGGVGGARFLRGLLHHLDSRPDSGDGPHEVTVIGNTADDVTLHGLRICPDLDTVMYTLGGGIHPEQGWGRAGETFGVAAELEAYGAEPQWFTLGDRDIATHLVRTRMLGLGYPLSAVTEALCARWQPGVRLLPMSDDPIETHVVIDDPDADPAPDGSPAVKAVHFQEWWVRLHAAAPARQILAVGIDQAKPAPGVLDAIADADVVVLPPSNPVVSIGTILAVPGIRDAIRATKAPVVGVSPIIGGAPVRGMADACLTAIGVETSAAAVADLYADFLGGWLVAPGDHGSVMPDEVTLRAVPLLMTDLEATAAIAGAALDLAQELAGESAGR